MEVKSIEHGEIRHQGCRAHFLHVLLWHLPFLTLRTVQWLTIPGKSWLKACLGQSVGFTLSQNCGSVKRPRTQSEALCSHPDCASLSLAPTFQACQSTFLSPSFLFDKRDGLFYNIIIYVNMYYILLFYKVVGIKCNHVFIFTVSTYRYTHTHMPTMWYVKVKYKQDKQ